MLIGPDIEVILCVHFYVTDNTLSQYVNQHQIKRKKSD